MKAYKYVWVIVFVLLTACAPPRPASEAPLNEPMPLAKREKETAHISSWVLSGGLAAKSPEKAWTASLNWQQTGINHYQIRLFGPLGSGTIIIEKSGQTITYKDGPKTVSSTNADELLYQQTGVRIPVRNLYYWVRGLKAPGAVQSTRYDQYNHLVTLKQAGYTIQYAKYTSINGVDLPSKIHLQGHHIKVKLIIKQWTV